MADKQNEKADSRQWFLRTGGETVFGPVSTPGLIVWAEQGRILPGHEVSNDRKKWVQAVSLDVLDMRWFVDDGEGELRGPLNRLAAEALIKSGKVSARAQIVSSDDVETTLDATKPQEVAKPPAPESLPEDVLRVRIRELESMVTGQRDRLAKLTNSDSLESLQQERDVLSSMVKSLEKEKDTILRNAEKDTRSYERKSEQFRNQIRKLEQQLEDANSRLLPHEAAVPPAPAETVDASALAAAAAELEQFRKTAEAEQAKLARERDDARGQLKAARRQLDEAGQAQQTAAVEREQVQKAAEAEQAKLARERDDLRDQLAAVQRELDEAKQALRTAQEAADRAADAADDALKKRVTALEQAAQFHASREAETQQKLETREAELAEEKKRSAAFEQRTTAAEAARSDAEQKAQDAETAFAELLSDANARDNAYAEKLAALEKTCALSPAETSQFFSDQAAVYELLKAEVDELSKTMELEKTAVERIREWSTQRQQTLTERRQTLLRRLGDSPSEMTRRTLREQPSDPNAARLRTELDNLKLAHQRELRLSEDRERDLARKLRVLEADSTKLQALAIEGDKRERRLQDLSELLDKREQELADERRTHQEEREQFQGSQQALLMRIESLEKTARLTGTDDPAAVEARNAKIASWMRLKK